MRTRLRATAYSGELPQQSPLPETRVEGLLDVLLRNNHNSSGEIIYLGEDTPARQYGKEIKQQLLATGYWLLEHFTFQQTIALLVHYLSSLGQCMTCSL